MLEPNSYPVEHVSLYPSLLQHAPFLALALALPLVLVLVLAQAQAYASGLVFRSTRSSRCYGILKTDYLPLALTNCM